MTDYFESHYACVRYPVGTEGRTGLWRAQLGAVHAIAAHFSRHRDPDLLEPAIVVMPTGSGKTEVLMLSPFVLRARRALVITPSRMVRAQIAEKFSRFGVLSKIEALVGDLSGLELHVQESKVESAQAWADLAQFDVVISTPNCVSPAYETIPYPPDDLFDLLLIDEAHHEPAKTWAATLSAFSSAKKVLFTATPFRRDKREIEGQIIYEFSIREAYRDGIYGEIDFVPVRVEDEPTEDVAIAKKVEEIHNRDRARDLEHAILVRTNTQIHARDLADVYEQFTDLNLRVLLGKHSKRYVKQTLRKLQQRDLDGIICVDMLGEGFDYPYLKIAAVHAPYKSLAATLQFIGRFARTSEAKLGKASFIAIPKHIRVGAQQLYREERIWQKIIPDLYTARVEQEVENRRAIATYEIRQTAGETHEEEERVRELSLYPLTPFHHVKIYYLPDGGSLDVEIALDDYTILRQDDSDELSSILVLMKEEDYPDWIALPMFPREQHHLIVIYYHAMAKLLFINSSCKTESLYREVASQIAVDRIKPLPLYRVDRVLSGLQGARLYNVGLRNRLPNTTTESYRIMAGPGVQKAFTRGDSRNYFRGHVFGGGKAGDEPVTLGYSSSGKVWSNAHSTLHGLVTWCRRLADRIVRDDHIETGTEFDAIPVGEPLDHLPEKGKILSIDWSHEIYNNPPKVTYVGPDDLPRNVQLLDLDLRIDYDKTDAQSVRVVISGDDMTWHADYTPTYPFFEELYCTVDDVAVCRGYRKISLKDFINRYPCRFFTVDQAHIHGGEIVKFNADFEPFNADWILPVDWESADVDIEKEFYKPGEPHEQRSIHEYLADDLASGSDDIVFYDHGSGEIADFVTFERQSDRLVVALYHVKASGGPEPSEAGRVGDVYEVCGQVVKSFIWLDRQELFDRIHHRYNSRSSKFVKGNLQQLEQMLEETFRLATTYKLVIVQPGIKQEPLPDKIANILAAANEYVVRANCMPLEVMASA